MKKYIWFIVQIALICCLYWFGIAINSIAQATWVQSTSSEVWKENSIALTIQKGDVAQTIITSEEKQQVDGFGVCFNELGWKALSVLDGIGRENILQDLFDTETGLKLSICRMPIGANDYALDYYSLNDSAGDFGMEYFTIDRDKKNLIPYIKAAMKYHPDLKLWGSPWTPPSWMKTNNHYACHPDVVNDMTPDQAGQEGKTQFRMSPEYLDAYALYFVRYIQAYRNEGINLTGIHVQNEMNSCQNFPSCIWTARDLGHFIGNYLGPAMKKAVPDAEIWYGTYERPWVEKIDSIMTDPVTSKYISGVSFQWAGKQAIPGVRNKYPDLKLMQSETECGNGSNDWKAAEYTFSLMKHYFDNGVSVYTFWNSILDESGKSMWGWKQNSMITVDSKTLQVKYNPEFYLLKHFSYFIRPGARLLTASGMTEGILAFRNPDSTVVVLFGNTGEEARTVKLGIDDRLLTATVSPHSINTFIVEPDASYYSASGYQEVAKTDVHCHINTKRTVFMESALKDNFSIVTVNVDAGTSLDDQLKYAQVQKKLFPAKLFFLTTFSLAGWDEPGWTEKTIARIESSVKQGASGVKVWKNIGMVEKDRNGKFIMIDDPGFDGVFDYLEKNRIPVCGHLGEPLNCWLPVEEMTVNNDKSYFREHPQYHMYLHPEYPSYEDQIRARDNMLRKHPDLIFMGAHLGSLEWSIDELAKRFDEFPNMTVDLAARTCHIQYQSQNNWQKVRNFFIKYQDRILYGTDSGDDGDSEPETLKNNLHEGWMRDWKYFTTNEVMTSPDVNGDFRGLMLPKEVIDKIYHRNAEKLFQ